MADLQNLQKRPHAGTPRAQDLAELLSALVLKASAPDDALARLDELAGRHTAALRGLTKRMQVRSGAATAWAK